MKRVILSSAMAALLAGGVAGAASADNTIDHRRGIMAAIGGHFGASVAILKGEQQHAGDRQFHAEAIAHLAKIAEDGFPEGSGEGKTKAKAAIWEEPEHFMEYMTEMQDNAQALVEAASGDDMRAYGGAIKNLGDSCKSCHDDFREE